MKKIICLLIIGALFITTYAHGEHADGCDQFNDENEKCHKWAGDDYCTNPKYRKFMDKKCQKSCCEHPGQTPIAEQAVSSSENLENFEAQIGEAPVELPSGKVALKKSKSKSLYLLLKKSEQGFSPAGQSYDGKEWESAEPLNFGFTCSGASCSVNIPKDGQKYQIVAIEGKDGNDITFEERIARVLIRASFGPTDETIEEFKSNSNFRDSWEKNLKKWIDKQVNMEPTSHREYLRQRVNPNLQYKNSFNIQNVYNPCQMNSRWIVSNKKWDGKYKLIQDTLYLKPLDPPVDGVNLLRKKLSGSCNPDWKKENVVLGKDSKGQIYEFKATLQLKTSTLENPLKCTNEDTACIKIQKNPFNEDSCVVDQESMIERCGSPGEVENDPSKGSRFSFGTEIKNDKGKQLLDQFVYLKKGLSGKSMIWFNIILNSSDQLRQRVAWALSEIFVISEEGLGQGQTRSASELWTTFYDILVRNSFKSFGNILKEVSFSPAMAKMLTFRNSNSLFYSMSRKRGEAYPDENYAREIMQLFTIGLFKLNMDGSYLLDKNDQKIPTYASKDIMSYSRAWTGFTDPWKRLNIENTNGPNSGNNIDPINIAADRRDFYPKLGINDIYIGDGYPLCSDLPKQHFLKKNAKYRYLGRSPRPSYISEPSYMYDGKSQHERFEPDVASSSLFKEICSFNQGTGGKKDKCQFKSTVRLSQDLTCDKKECKVDAVRVLKFKVSPNDPNSNDYVYYEHERQPCVEFQIFNNAIVSAKSNNMEAYCEDPLTARTLTPCCNQNDRRKRVVSIPQVYGNEFATLETGKARCEEAGYEVCKVFVGFSSKIRKQYNRHYYQDASCQVQVQIRNDGKVSIHHKVPAKQSKRPNYKVQLDNLYQFQVLWNNNQYPSVANNCGGDNNICEVRKDTCVCNTDVKVTSVFSDVNSLPKNFWELKKSLSIGALQPKSSFKQIKLYNGLVTVFFDNNKQLFNENTVFGLKQYGANDPMKFYANKKSTVHVGSNEFRNPPAFLNYAQQTRRDALHETDATLDHYIYHQNTAPFIAKHLIQKLVSSNPSRNYVRRVAIAFKYGKFKLEGSNEVIGSQTYGDLQATIYAVYLDPEANSLSMEAHPAFGSLREPLLKISHLLRSLDLKTVDNNEVELPYVNQDIGQSPYTATSIFSFFQQDFTPNVGRIAASSGLVAPESQILTSPHIVSYLNAVLSLTRFGLSDCYGGFGAFKKGRNCWKMQSGRQNWRDFSLGSLMTMEKQSEKDEYIKNLDVLLTGGRMTDKTLKLLNDAFDEKMQANDNNTYQSRVLTTQLASIAPEFHCTNDNSPLNKLQVNRQLEQYQQSSSDDKFLGQSRELSTSNDYKAIVYLYLGGGCDSWNILTPYADCPNNLGYDHYKKIRTVVALTKAELTEIEAKNQHCGKYAVNKNLKTVAELYKKGEASFVANIGTLVEPLTAETYKKKTRQIPASLFAHNIQKKAAQSLFAQNPTSSNGILGRVKDTLQLKQSMRVNSYSISGNAKVLQGAPGKTDPADIIDSNSGVIPFDQSHNDEVLRRFTDQFTESSSTSLYAETWLQNTGRAITRADYLYNVIKQAKLKTPYKTVSSLDKQFKKTAEIIAERQKLNTDRDLFYLNIGGFDSHHDAKINNNEKFTQIDSAINLFKQEMEKQGLWNKVTIVIASEFGRTINSNGVGTDHGWGGNTFFVGGAVKGGQIHGTYPKYLDENESLIMKRGRIIPSTSWETYLSGVLDWYGLEEQNVKEVIPNVDNFPRWDAKTLFK